MTNKDRLVSLLGFRPSDSNSVEGALIDEGLAASDPYTAANILQIKKCELALLNILISTPDTQNETGIGYQKKYDRDAILKRIAILEEEITPTVVVGSSIKSIRMW